MVRAMWRVRAAGLSAGPRHLPAEPMRWLRRMKHSQRARVVEELFPAVEFVMQLPWRAMRRRWRSVAPEDLRVAAKRCREVARHLPARDFRRVSRWALHSCQATLPPQAALGRLPARRARPYQC